MSRLRVLFQSFLASFYEITMFNNGVKLIVKCSGDISASQFLDEVGKKNGKGSKIPPWIIKYNHKMQNIS